MKISKAQAEGFLKSLWPESEHSYLATHTRSFLQGLVGEVPARLWSPSDEQYNPQRVKDARLFAEALRSIADEIQKGSEMPNT